MPPRRKRSSAVPAPEQGLLCAPPSRPLLMAGIDEAGRGCLAGPVVAAAVILPERYDLPGLTDSKALSAARRDHLAPLIRQCALAWGLGVIWPATIDRINILQATFEAMSRAVASLRRRPCLLLVDGNKTVPGPVLLPHWRKRHADAPDLPRQHAVVGGDRSVPAISAASILAKTYRDRLMEHLDRHHPGYGFARHKGYGTADHYEALHRLGPCRQHRLTFRGVLPRDEGPGARQGSLL